MEETPLSHSIGDFMRRKLRDGCDVLIGNCLNSLKTLPDESIHCCITSPPYYGLRDYGGEDEQIGLEETPEQFIENLVKVFREVKRVLHSSGTLWLNIGDSYWGGKGASGQISAEKQEARTNTISKGHSHVGGAKKTRPTDKKHDVIKPKDLIGIPWMLAFALRADGWYLRQDIIWHKNAVMPESVKDRCTKSHEYIFLLSKSKKYFYDSEAIKEKALGIKSGNKKPQKGTDQKFSHTKQGLLAAQQKVFHTKNKRSVWTVNPKPYAEAHFAVYPPELIEPCVLAGTSQGGCCSKCFEPYVRTTGRPCQQCGEIIPTQGKECKACGFRNTEWLDERENNPEKRAGENNTIGSTTARKKKIVSRSIVSTEYHATCDCKNAEQIPCTVLDPFGGSGTTAGVALKHRRNAILCELNNSYFDLMAGRIKEITGLHDGQKTLFTLFQNW